MSMTDQSPAQDADPGHTGDGPASNEWVNLIKWLLSDHSRTAWILAFLVVILGVCHRRPSHSSS